MPFPAFALLTLTLLCPAFAAAQSTLNKCVDAKGMVTYTNKPCLNARKAETIEIDPAPVPDKPRVQPPTPEPAARAAGVTTAPPPVPMPAPATVKLETQRSPKRPALDASSKQCDSLSDKLGKALDKMDQARRKGYTLEQMNKWNEEVRELERKKQQSGCF